MEMQGIIDLTSTLYAADRGCGMYSIFKLMGDAWMHVAHIQIRDNQLKDEKLKSKILNEYYSLDNEEEV